MIEKPKKERRFLKTLGKIGEILLQEVLLKVGSNLVKRIGGKKTLPSILFLFLSISLYAQYPATGNKQRLGYQTTGDGLVYRGRASDTVGIKSSGINNAYFILDTVNNILYNYIKTKGGWKFSNGDTVIINNTVDTTSLSNRINLKVNKSDTASMLLPYLRKADTASMLTPYFRDSDTTSLNLTSRFATKLNISDTSSMLTNYLRSGVASNTYLPLSGGILSKTTTYPSNDSILTKLFIRSGGNNFIPTYAIFAEAEHHIENSTLGIFGSGSTIYGSAIGVKGSGVQKDMNAFGTAIGVRGDVNATFANSGGTNGTTYAGYFNNNATVDGNNYGLFVNTSDKGDYGIYQTGTGINYFGSNSTFAGTLGVTSTTTLTGALTVNNATVLNEGSGDFDTRIESDGNANMVFVDASTDRVGIGTNTPSKTLDVNGTLSVTGIANFSNQITISGSVSGTNRLLGKNTSNNGIGDVTIGTGLNLSASDVLTAIGTDTTSLSDRINLKYNSSGGTISGAVTLSTTTATPTSLLGKSNTNVIGEVTTVAQTGLMTRGSTTATTGTPSAVFDVNHGLGFNPTSVIVTGAGTAGAQKLIFEVYAKNSTTFSVQVWTYLGMEASSTSVTIYWLAIK